MRARRNNRGCSCKAMGVGCVSVCGCRVGRMFSVSGNSPVLDLDFILVIDCLWSLFDGT